MSKLIIDIQGTVLNELDKQYLSHKSVAGIILFSRNYISREQLIDLTSHIKEVRSDLCIFIDQEGGRVQRFLEGFTRLPALSSFGALYEQDKSRALAISQTCGWLMASELIACGIDLSFAPVVDLDYALSEVIGNRSFHSDPIVVAKLATAYMLGMSEAGMANNIKHFPGHGYVAADSHLELPVDKRSFANIEQQDLVPFAKLIAAGKVKSVMSAHIVYSQVDKQVCTFSKVWLQDILRKQLGFTGLIISDDLSMAGAKQIGSITKRIQAATDAGCDLLLVCNSPDDLPVAFEYMGNFPAQTQINNSLLADSSLCKTWEELVSSAKYHSAKAQIEQHVSQL